MPRSRNIKPAFLSNDELAENNSALGRLFFIGLWMIADFKGNLEFRPTKLKAQLLPYDDCDIEQLAINLDKSGFIRYYSDGEALYINIVKFSTHQNPHKNEKLSGTTIPDYSEEGRQLVDLDKFTINLDKSSGVQKTEKKEERQGKSLIPAHKFTDEDYAIAKRMLDRVRFVAPSTPEPNLERWADVIRLMREIDGLSHEKIKPVFLWANKDDFWKTNILSPKKLRKQFAVLEAKMLSEKLAPQKLSSAETKRQNSIESLKNWNPDDED